MQNQSEILNETQNLGGGSEVDVASQNTDKQHKSDTHRDASDFDFSQQHTAKNDDGIKQYDVGDRISCCK